MDHLSALFIVLGVCNLRLGMISKVILFGVFFAKHSFVKVLAGWEKVQRNETDLSCVNGEHLTTPQKCQKLWSVRCFISL